MEFKEGKITLTEKEREDFGRVMQLCNLFANIQGMSKSLNDLVEKYTQLFIEKGILEEHTSTDENAPKNVSQIRIMIDGILNNMDFLGEQLDNIEKEVREELITFQKLHMAPVMEPAKSKSGIILPN